MRTRISKDGDHEAIDSILVNITRTGHVSQRDAEILASYISQLRENRKLPPQR